MRYPKATLLIMAQQAGAELEFKGSWVKEVSLSKWLTFKQMYYRLYRRGV